MLSASDFIDVHLLADDSATQQKYAASIEEISTLTKLEKTELANELLAIAVDTTEPKLRRVQAARTLGHQARRLEIIGTTPIALAVLKTLRGEFNLELNDSNIPRSAELLSLTGMEYFLFEYFAYLAFIVDQSLGNQLAGKINNLGENTSMARQIRLLFERARQERSR